MRITRIRLKVYENKIVSCRGTFISVNASHKDYCQILLYDVYVEDLYYKHLWVTFNCNFKGLNLIPNSKIVFPGKVEKYKNQEKYGIRNVGKVRIVKRGDLSCLDELILSSDKEYRNTLSDSVMKHYHISVNTEIRFEFNSSLTEYYGYKNIDCIALKMFCNGKRNNKCRIRFNPMQNDGKLILDDQFYLKIDDELYRRLSLVYFLSKNSCFEYRFAVKNKKIDKYMMKRGVV